MKPLLRKLSFFTATMFCLAALVSVLMRPEGLPLMLQKYREMVSLNDEVRLLRDKVHRKHTEVERLRVSEEERQRAIRQHLNKALPGETVIILPEGQPAQPAPQTGEDSAGQ